MHCVDVELATVDDNFIAISCLRDLEDAVFHCSAPRAPPVAGRAGYSAADDGVVFHRELRSAARRPARCQADSAEAAPGAVLKAAFWSCSNCQIAAAARARSSSGEASSRSNRSAARANKPV